MATIKHYGLYRFHNVKYPGTGSGRVLNAYGTTSLAEGRNVMLYTNDPKDKAQQWRAMYAGKVNDNRYLYWLNCALDIAPKPYALDRFMGTPKDNADVYHTCNYNDNNKSLAKDQLVYFIENKPGQVSICLYCNNYALTAASDANGGNNPSQLDAPGNCYWAKYDPLNNAQKWNVEVKIAGADPSGNATTFPVSCFYNETNNSLYPQRVGECTWYCRGRFYEVYGVDNIGEGDAANWATCNLYGKASRDTSSKTLRAKSIAVFSGGSFGHVVFIESLSGGKVFFSESNGSNYNGKVIISNGQIEVHNSLLTQARDGYIQDATEDEFRNLYEYTLKAIIYK